MERVKMSRLERAKQFMPFDALKGLKQALRNKELEHERKPKIELSEDENKIISSTLSLLKNGDQVKVEYFCDGFTKTVMGDITLKLNDKFIIVDNNIIELENITKIVLEEENRF